MVTKEDISEKINEIFGIDLDFTKMTKEDLEKMLECLEPTNLVKIGLMTLRNKARKEVLDRPLREFLASAVETTTEKSEEADKGPFGLGLLPKVREVLSEKALK